jgi:hypothetical protein
MEELAGSNVNRAYSLAATSLSIFTFMLVFLYPRIASGEVDALVFQVALGVMAIATFSFVFAAFAYYGSSLASRVAETERLRLARNGDALWLLGYTLLFLVPTVILVAVRLQLVAVVWFALWLVYLAVVIRYFPRVLTPQRSASARSRSAGGR